MTDARMQILARQLARAFDERSWHGPNLMGSIRGVDAAEAAWRPGPERHNIWELVVHAAYWKYRVVRLVAEDPPVSFDLEGSNFFERPEGQSGATARAWEADRTLLRAWHGRLMSVVEGFDGKRLDESASAEWTYLELIAGAGAHDLYHAGQIRLLRRLRGGLE